MTAVVTCISKTEFRMLNRQLLFKLCFGLGLFGSVSHAYAQAAADQNPLPLSSSNWTATEADGNLADTGTSGQHQIAMVLPENSKHFEIFFTGFQSSLTDGTNISITVTFDTGQSMSFSGVSNSGEVKANLDDSAVAAWTHNLTADHMMGITFAGISEGPWTIPLTGTTPTVAAMATAIKIAGIDGLPGPWNIDLNNSSPATISNGSEAVSSEPQQLAEVPNINCQSFAEYIQSIPNFSNEPAIMDQFFNVDLTRASDQQMDDLIAQATACMDSLKEESQSYFNSNMAESGTYLQLSRAIEDIGISELQQVKRMNDAVVQAAAAAQQNRIDTQKNLTLIADLPACDDSDTISNVEDTVANSPAGKVNGLVLLGLKNIDDISGPPNMGYRVCKADALFNNGEREVIYKMNWFDKSKNMFSIVIQDEN